MSLREKEITAISKVLSINNGDNNNDEFIDNWKVLVYDQDCRDIISPLLNVGALRQKGVTLHMLLHSDREAIPDAPAVYFVRPSLENVKRIAEDCAKGLYRSVYLHFLTRLERPIMEQLAHDLVASNSVSMISKVYDQYLDVIALEPSLFTLNINDSFIAYNDPSLGEQQIKSFISRNANGLLSLVRVLGTIPIIRAPTGGCAAMVANELHEILRENLSPRGAAQSLFADCLVSDRPRPLLLIFDRTVDMSSPLLHTSTYQALIDDLLDHKLNKVTVDTTSKDDANVKKRTYDLNTQSDPFFVRYAGSPFPEAVEANEKELAEVSQRESEIRTRPSISAFSTNNNVALDGQEGKELSEAIESLPEILAKKTNLEAHTNILQAVMKQIAAREVPTYFELEQSLLTAGRIIDKAAVLTLLRDGSKGNLLDKTRLLCLIATLSDTSSKIDEYETAFIQGCAVMSTPPPQDLVSKKVGAASFVRRLQSLQSPMAFASRMAGGSSQGPSNAMLSSILTSAQSAMAKAASFFTKFAPVYVTKVVDSLAEGRSCPEDDSFLTLDPKVRTNEAIENKGQKYSDVIVFVIGGGCYSEFYNLQELIKQKNTSGGGNLRSIIYGCSELTCGDNFIVQFFKLFF